MSEHAPVYGHPLFNHQPDWMLMGQHGHVEHAVDVAAAPEALWRILSDPSTWGSWLTVHDHWSIEPPAVFAVGQRLTATTLMLGIANTIKWTVESVTAPAGVVLSGAGQAGLKLRLAFTITPLAFGSRVSVTWDFAGSLLTETLIGAVEDDGVVQLAASIVHLDTVASSAPQAPARPALRLVHSVPEHRVSRTVRSAPALRMVR